MNILKIIGQPSMREAEFLHQFFKLLGANVIGLNLEQTLQLMQEVANEIPKTNETEY